MTERVRITHQRTRAARRVVDRPPTNDIGEQTELGELYMRALIRSQLRLAGSVCATVAILLGGTALLGAFAPGWGSLRLFGMSVPWLVLGLLVYPLLTGLAVYAVTRLERNESAFVELVRRR